MSDDQPNPMDDPQQGEPHGSPPPEDTTEPRTEWWATCDDCLTNVVVKPHPERPDDIPHPDEWEAMFPACYVCDGTLHWNSDDIGTN